MGRCWELSTICAVPDADNQDGLSRDAGSIPGPGRSPCHGAVEPMCHSY